ncbi:IS3 family transposase [Arthrobacter oryzae]|uniref:Integrase catalytic domain-containing protein n=1 Tax=Arthrobacter oryzae TaxID=409290 RepID=A0A3N0C8Y9_9MICC|nr:hypothetical protein D7003_02940 [Arthrobacter oryzae]
MSLQEYIRWYNTERIPTKFEGLSPVQYLPRPSPRRLLLGQSNFRGPVQSSRCLSFCSSGTKWLVMGRCRTQSRMRKR